MSTSTSLLFHPESWESHLVLETIYNQESFLPEEVSTPSNTSRSLGMLLTSQRMVLISNIISSASTRNSLKCSHSSEENIEITFKRKPLKKEDDINEKSARLPIPCPLPSVYSTVVQTRLLQIRAQG